ncbi:MAG: inositol 2-dehydrogenase [Gammaproteobacteria bacterium]|nr:inositol 2-dehydrogenase [Gammaproteobacteria bacterium]
MIGVAVIGCGRIGRLHAQVLARHARASLVAVFDAVAAVAAQIAGELHAKAAASIEEVLADRSVHAVVIASPTATHVPLIGAAVKAGKAVFCEKPIDLNLEPAVACWREIASLQPRVMLGFNRRFDASFSALRERLQAGAIGKLELAIITSRDPAPPGAEYLKGSGGLFRDMSIHDFDMARWLAGEIVEVHALGANLVDPLFGELNDIDTSAITLRAASGALLQINNSRRCAYGYDQRIEVFGSKGMLQAHNQRATSVEVWDAQHTAAQDVLVDFFMQRYREAYAAEIDSFISALERQVPMSPDFGDGLAAQRLALAAEESRRSGRAIRMAPVTTP